MNPSNQLIDELAAQSRVLIQARVLPDGPLDERATKLVRDDFHAWINRHGVFNEQVSRETDIPVEAISQWRMDTLADADRVTRALNDWMEGDARRRRGQVTQAYIPTRAAEAMRGIVHAA
jgi:hypothetical protein